MCGQRKVYFLTAPIVKRFFFAPSTGRIVWEKTWDILRVYRSGEMVGIPITLPKAAHVEGKELPGTYNDTDTEMSNVCFVMCKIKSLASNACYVFVD